jgi:membrane protease YdiL (CAAX protease family)
MGRILPVFALFVALAATSFTSPLGMSLMPEPPFGLRIARLALIAALDFTLLFGLLRLGGVRLVDAIGSAGLHRPDPRLWAVGGVIAFVAVIAATAIAGPPSFEPLQTFAWNAALGPVCEEIIFRGVALGVLVKLCGWPFWRAVFAPAVFFGIGHMAQAEAPLDALGVIALTALGGVFFGWLWKAWGQSLWPPIVAHVTLNALWAGFDLGENALGGAFANALRFAIALAWIVATTWIAGRSANHASPRSAQGDS